MTLDPDARVYATIDGKDAPLPEGCQWFAACDNYANGIRPHPAFAGGGVPICKRCDDKVERIKRIMSNPHHERLEYLRRQIRAERISYSEIAELQSLAPHIDPSDVELLEWAGVEEYPGES